MPSRRPSSPPPLANPKRRSNPAYLAIPVLALLLLTVHQPRPRTLSALTHRPPIPPPPSHAAGNLADAQPAPHDVCLIIGRDGNADTVWRRNSRSVCVTSRVCLPTDGGPLKHSSDFRRSTCRLVTPAYTALPLAQQDVNHGPGPMGACDDIQHRLQLCPRPAKDTAPCIPRNASGDLRAVYEASAQDGSLFSGVTFVVPRYPFAANIFHFATTLSTVAHAVSNLRNILAHSAMADVVLAVEAGHLPVNILFLHQRRRKLPWQAALQAILEARMRERFPHLSVAYLPEIRAAHVCVERPVHLGQLGHVNAWAFPNASAIDLTGRRVPKASVEMRDAVYAATGLPGVFSERGRVDLPPLVVGYSRRAGRGSAIGKGVHAAGTVRRFSAEDDAWLTGMLRDEAAAVGAVVDEFTMSADESFAEQVRRMTGVGVVVGIHGANLANSVFMRPFGGLLEIFPANMHSSCYMGGGNAGLAYAGHEAVLEASPQESGCAPEESRCWNLTRQRLVKIGTRRDRDAIRMLVRDALTRLRDLRARFAHSGVPVTFDAVDQDYFIVE